MANNYSINDCSGKVKAFYEEHQADPITSELPALPENDRVDLFGLSDAEIFVLSKLQIEAHCLAEAKKFFETVKPCNVSLTNFLDKQLKEGLGKAGDAVLP